MMNLHFIRRGLSPHGSNNNNGQAQRQSSTPNSSSSQTSSFINNNNHSTDTNTNSNHHSSSCSLIQRNNMKAIDDLDDFPSPPSLFSSAISSVMTTMNASINTYEGDQNPTTTTIIQQQPPPQPSPSEEFSCSSSVMKENQAIDPFEGEEIVSSQTLPILETQFPPSLIHSNFTTKKNGLLGQGNNRFESDKSIDGEEEESDDDVELREFSIKQLGQSIRKKRKLNIVKDTKNTTIEKSENSLVEENKQTLLTQLPTTKQSDGLEVNQQIDEDEFLNDATAPRGNEIIKSLEDNIIEEFTFTPDEESSQIPKHTENTHSKQVEEDFDIHVDLHELDYDFSTNMEATEKTEEPTKPKKSYIDMAIQTDNLCPPKSESVQNVNSDPSNTCSICLSSWSSTGLHQVCCLSCGHLFGKNCIEKWLKKNSACPKCKKSADRSQIRLLYVDNIHAVDTQKIEDLENLLKEETKAKKELELIKNGLELRIKMLTEQKGNLNHIEDTQKTTNSDADANKRKSLIQRSLELAERKKREFDQMNSEEDGIGTIVCNNGKPKTVQQSRKKNTYLYGSSGANKLLFNTPLENSGLIEISNNQIFINFERKDKTCGFYVLGLEQFTNNPSMIQQTRKVVHNSPISDIKPHYLLSSNNSKGYNLDYSQANLILTSSFDKSMRITDLRQGTANSVCFCPYLSTNREGPMASITCCEWNRTNQNYCFAGLSSGSILCYDIRNPGVPFLTTGDQSSSPHTMFHIPNKGLLVGSNSSISYYDENQYGYTKGHKLFSKEISSLNFNTSNNTILFTCRESSKSSQLQLFTLESNQQVSCLENISINHKGPKLGRPYVSDNGQNYLSTIAVPKPEDFSVEIWKSQTDQDYSFKSDIKLNTNTEIIQSCALSFNNLFVVTRDNLSAYLI